MMLSRFRLKFKMLTISRVSFLDYHGFGFNLRGSTGALMALTEIFHPFQSLGCWTTPLLAVFRP
jgi:hypothetical protein